MKQNNLLIFILLMFPPNLTADFGEEKTPLPESRGMSTWFASFDTKEKADQVLADYERAGMNTFYAMVWWYRAFYPTDEFPSDPDLDPDFDPITYLIKECHKRGWDFYAWFVNGRVHPELTPDYDRYDDWRIVNADGERQEQRLDYNIPEVRERERDIMLDFLERYPQVDGFQFDYIRFPWQGGYSYTDRTRELYKKEKGYDPFDLVHKSDDLDPDDLEQKRNEWHQWQRDNVRKLLEKVYTGTKEINPEILVGSAVMGRKDWAERAEQTWWEWVNDGLFEFVKTMYYENDPDRYTELSDTWRRLIETDNHHRISYPVGGSTRWHDGDYSVVSDCVELARKGGARMIFFFRYGSMDEELLDHLGEGVFSERVPPYKPEPGTDACLKVTRPAEK